MFSHLFRHTATSDSFVPLILVVQDQFPLFVLRFEHEDEKF